MGRSIFLNIDLSDHSVYTMQEMPPSYRIVCYILNIRPLICVFGCDVALTGSGYVTFFDTKLRSYNQYIGSISIIYVWVCICVFVAEDQRADK